MHPPPAPRDAAPAERLAAKLFEIRECSGGHVFDEDRVESQCRRSPEPPVELLQVRQDEYCLDELHGVSRRLFEALELRTPPRLDGHEATTGTQHATHLFDNAVDVYCVADGFDREDHVEGLVCIRQAVKVSFVNVEVAAGQCDKASRPDVPGCEVDPDEGHVRVPPGEAEQVEPPTAADLEHALRVQQADVFLDDQRLCVVAATMEAPVGIECHVHRAAHRVPEEISGRALREVRDERIETAPLRKQPGKIEMRTELRQALGDIRLGVRARQTDSNLENCTSVRC